MLTLKRIDVWGQLILIILFIILTVIRKGEIFFWAYFIVGGWQIVSTLLHLLLRIRQPLGESRTLYQLCALLAVIAFPLGGAFFILFFAPIMALWYLSISYR